MLYQVPILTLLTTGVISANHMAPNRSDVVVTYQGHAEAGVDSRYIFTSSPAGSIVGVATTYNPVTELFKPDDRDDVVFIPSVNRDRAVRIEDDDRVQDELVRVEDVFMNRRTVGDGGSGKLSALVTDPPAGDIFFVAGKNKVESDKKEKTKQGGTRKENHIHFDAPEVKLNCSNLDCNNTVESVCGGKMERNQWKYRLFLNDCFFRRVNCDFRNEINRYRIVSLNKCKNIGGHYTRPKEIFEDLNYYRPSPPPTAQYNVNARRGISGRRATNMGADGLFCDHVCPALCTDEYDPQCAISTAGDRKVFVNHCQLDRNSCVFDVVWRQRPLSECVGGRTADMRQNRAFYGWMQRVGILDNKGKLVLS